MYIELTEKEIQTAIEEYLEKRIGSVEVMINENHDVIENLYWYNFHIYSKNSKDLENSK